MIAIPNKIKQHQDKTVRKHSGIPTYEKNMDPCSSHQKDYKTNYWMKNVNSPQKWLSLQSFREKGQPSAR